MAAAIERLPGSFVSDAELTVDEPAGSRHSSAYNYALTRQWHARCAPAKLHPARLYIFDLFAAQERDPAGAPRSQRKEMLRDNGRTRARGKRGLTAAKATASMRHAVAAGIPRAVAGRTCAAHARCRDRHARGQRAALRTRHGIVALGDAAKDFECAATRTIVIVIVDRHDVSTRR